MNPAFFPKTVSQVNPRKAVPRLLTKMNTKSARLAEIYNRSNGHQCPVFQKELYDLAREIVNPGLDGWNNDINHTLCEIETHIENGEIEYDYLAEQLYDEVYCYVNGVKSTKYFWYKDHVYIKTKLGKVLFTECTMRRDYLNLEAGTYFPAIELDWIKMSYTFYRNQYDFTHVNSFKVEL